MFVILLISIQTLLGRSVFELTILSVLTGILLIVWLGTALASFILFVNRGNGSQAKEMKCLEKPVTDQFTMIK